MTDFGSSESEIATKESASGIREIILESVNEFTVYQPKDHLLALLNTYGKQDKLSPILQSIDKDENCEIDLNYVEEWAGTLLKTVKAYNELAKTPKNGRCIFQYKNLHCYHHTTRKRKLEGEDENENQDDDDDDGLWIKCKCGQFIVCQGCQVEDTDHDGSESENSQEPYEKFVETYGIRECNCPEYYCLNCPETKLDYCELHFHDDDGFISRPTEDGPLLCNDCKHPNEDSWLCDECGSDYY